MQNVSFRSPGLWRHWYVNASGITTSDVYIPSSGEFVIRTQSGYTGPRPQVKPMPFHAYSLNVQRMALYHIASYHYTNGNHEYADGQGLNTIVSGATLYPTYDWSALEERALNALNEKVRGGLDVSVDLAESGKTLKMLRVRDQILDYTKAFAGRFGSIKVAGNAWLMWQYGIRPSLQTLFGAANENLRSVMNKTERFSVRVSDKYFPQKVNVNAVVGSVDFNVKAGTSIKVSVTYGLDLRTDQFDLARWSTLNPIGIAYELLPFSFVADWFLNIGGYLRNAETYLLYANKFNSGYKTRLAVGLVPFELFDYGQNSGEIVHSSFWKGQLAFTDINRTVLGSYPFPSLPSFRANLGSSQLLSGAALLSQFLDGGGNKHQRASRGALRAVQESVSLFQAGKPAKVFRFSPTHYML